MGELSDMLNIGKEVERQLNEVGIFTSQQLREVGSRQAWLKIKANLKNFIIHLRDDDRLMSCSMGYDRT